MKKYIVFIIINILIYNKTTHCQSLFDTSYYEIDFISNKIEDTKLEKIRNIKTKSFINILKKTLEEEQYKKISKSISEGLINTFIRNIIINDEKIINNKYYSTIKINFDKKKNN